MKRLTALLSLLAAVATAQDAPKIKPGYATDGRPGFVAYYTVEDLKWQRASFPSMPKGLSTKLLSRDTNSGAVSLMLYYPNGWRQEEPGYHSGDEELFVLEGDLSIGDQKLSKYSYAFFPAGMSHGPVTSIQGAVVLSFYTKPLDFTASRTHKPGARVHAAVRDWNFYRTPWNTAGIPVYRKGPPLPGLRAKLLRNDPDTGEMTWMTFGVGGGPGGGAGLWEVHPTFEEYFLVERSAESTIGECLPSPTPMSYGDRGYWYRPADIGHIGGISHSTGYGLSFVRTGGPLWAYYYTDCSYRQEVEITDQKGGFKPIPFGYRPGPEHYSHGAALVHEISGEGNARPASSTKPSNKR